jgi:hypothetical protein
MQITETLLRAAYRDSMSRNAYYFNDGLLFAAKEFGHITEKERQEWARLNDTIYEECKYDDPVYDE